MNIRNALSVATKSLMNKKVLKASTSIDAEILLSYILKKPKEYLYTYPEKNLTKSQCARFFLLIRRRLKYEPIAYMVDKKEFYGRKFFVNKNVLIPRPATESLVEEVIHYCQMSNVNGKLSIADIGTGSGCIAITLAKEIPRATIYATDISAKALHVAKKNAKTHSAKIAFYKGNLLEPLKKKKIDIIVANLPYLNFKEKNVYKKILKYEPQLALYAKHGGIIYYKKLFQQINQYKIIPMIILCEISPKQKLKMEILTKKYLPSYNIQFKKDYSRYLRLVILKH